jgi:hypothetical protein
VLDVSEQLVATKIDQLKDRDNATMRSEIIENLGTSICKRSGNKSGWSPMSTWPRSIRHVQT